MRMFRCVCLSFVPLAFLSVTPAGADESGHVQRGHGDHDRARRALEDGRVRPLSEILSAVQAQVPGDVVRVELEDERGGILYEIRVLTPAGQVVEIKVDAASARILEVED